MRVLTWKCDHWNGLGRLTNLGWNWNWWIGSLHCPWSDHFVTNSFDLTHSINTFEFSHNTQSWQIGIFVQILYTVTAQTYEVFFIFYVHTRQISVLDQLRYLNYTNKLKSGPVFSINEYLSRFFIVWIIIGKEISLLAFCSHLMYI